MKRSTVMFGACLLAAAVVPSAAQACLHGRSLRRQVDPTLRDVRQAEQLLADGKYDKAVRRANRAIRDLDQLSASNASKLSARAQRVAALAAVRSQGVVGPGRTWKGKSATEQTTNVIWAAMALQVQAALQPDNTVLQTEYAEALAAVPFMDGVAFAILNRLSDDDLMPTARGYVLLAQLQKQRGDQGGLQLSLARCNDITRHSGACEVA